MKNRLIALAAAAVLAIPSLARPASWDICPIHTQVQFTTRKLLLKTVQGTLTVKGVVHINNEADQEVVGVI